MTCGSSNLRTPLLVHIPPELLRGNLTNRLLLMALC